MIDELREEAIVNKVGGRFKLSTLIQKRMVALNAGARPLVDLKTDNKLEVVIQEIMQDKIYLDTSANLKITGGSAVVIHRSLNQSGVTGSVEGAAAQTVAHRRAPVRIAAGGEPIAGPGKGVVGSRCV